MPDPLHDLREQVDLLTGLRVADEAALVPLTQTEGVLEGVVEDAPVRTAELAVRRRRRRRWPVLLVGAAAGVVAGAAGALLVTGRRGETPEGELPPVEV